MQPGVQRVVNRAALVPDQSLTIEGSLPVGVSWKLAKDVAREMGVRTNVLRTDRRRKIVYRGPPKTAIVVATKTGGAELDFTPTSTRSPRLKRPVEGERREGSCPRQPYLTRARPATAPAPGSGCAPH